MGFKIDRCVDSKFYFICLSNLTNKTFDKHIAEYLDIEYKEYINILLKNGAIRMEEFEYECFFKLKKDVNKTVKILEPYLILAELTK